MKIFLSIALASMILSCKSDRDAVEAFKNCLEPNQRQAYLALEKLCDDFIISNYPDLGLNEGYRAFLKDLENSADVHWAIDSISILTTNRILKEAFGKYYNETAANFQPLSNLTNCMSNTSNRRVIDNFLKDKTSVGAMSPNILAGAMKAHEIDPTKGLMKIIFVTEVVFRLQYARINDGPLN